MSGPEVILTLRIDTQNPIELDSFVGAFTSLATEYRRQMREEFPNADSDAQIFVKEVRQGSYIADLVPYLVPIVPVVAAMDQVLVVESFVKSWGQRITALATGSLADWNPSKGELDSFNDAVQAIANDPEATSTLESATFDKEGRKVGVAFKFSTKEAKKCQKTIDNLYREKQPPEDNSKYERVLMVFTRTDVGNANLGKKSGERVVIRKISDRRAANHVRIFSR